MNGTELAATDLVAGVDVSKARLDTQVEPGAATRSFPNDAAGQRAARDWLRRLGVRRVVLEPTGRYQRALHRCLVASRSSWPTRCRPGSLRAAWAG